MKLLNYDTFPCSVKYVKVAYITKEIYIMIIYWSQLFSEYN